MSARDDVLGRIRTALGTTRPTIDVPRDYRRSSDLDRDAILELFVDRLVDYKAAVRRCPAPELATTLSTALDDLRAQRIGVPPNFDPTLLAQREVLVDDGLATIELDTLHAAVTGAHTAVAETGTIVLDAATAGRRALTLVPDVHVCVVHESDVVATVPEAVTRLAGVAGPLTWVSGPSATSDIELSRVEGVHGPRTLVVVLVGDR